MVISAKVGGVPLTAGLDSFAEICAIDRNWAYANLPPFQPTAGFGEARAALVSLFGNEGTVPQGPDLTTEALGVMVQLHFRLIDFPPEFPVPCLLGTEFFRKAGPITINLDKNSVHLYSHEEFFISHEVAAAYYTWPQQERPCARWCPHRRFLLATPPPIPAGLPDSNDRRFTGRHSQETILTWMRDVLSVYAFGFPDDIRRGRFTFPVLHRAYEDVMGKESLRQCRCRLFTAFEERLLGLAIEGYQVRF